MNELVELADFTQPFPVDARELHARLGAARDFSTWIKERLERFAYTEGLNYQKSERLSSPDSGSTKARPQVLIEYRLTASAAKTIAAVENTPEGRGILSYLVRVESAWNTPEMALVRGLQAAEEIIRQKTEQISLLAADARVAQRIASADGCKRLSDIGKINGLGPRKFIALMLERGILFRRGDDLLPYQEYVDSGYFKVREAPYEDSAGVERLANQALVTGKGEVWLAKQFFPVHA